MGPGLSVCSPYSGDWRFSLIEDQSAMPLEYAQRLFVRLVAALARRSPAQFMCAVISNLRLTQSIDDW
jgi:hypothetical protein